MEADLQCEELDISLDGAQFVVTFWPEDLAVGENQCSVLAIWAAGNCPSGTQRRVITFAGRLGLNAHEQYLECTALLGAEPMLPAHKNPKTFLAICRPTGKKPAPEDVAGHRRNSARNFSRLLAAISLSKTDDRTAVDCTAYLYEATSKSEMHALLARDPLATLGIWQFEIFSAKINRNALRDLATQGTVRATTLLSRGSYDG